MRAPLLILLAVALLGAGCLGRRTPTRIPIPTPTATAAALPTPTVSPSPSPAAPGASGLEAALAEIEGHVPRLRGRDFTGPVPRFFVDEAELRRELERDFNKPENREIMAREEALYKALGLLDRSADYSQLILALYTEQVLGFYDTEEQRLVVVQRGARFAPVDKITFAHELAHALQQQHFDINSLIKGVKRQKDASLALSALVEGDAVLLQSQYMTAALSREEQAEFFREAARTPSPVFEGAPAVVREALFFPYQVGNSFVASIFRGGGWGTVDQLYSRPPASTEQVLHPQKYILDEKPKEVALPDPAVALGSGAWRRLDSDTLGEFYLSRYLGRRLDDATATAAAAGWGGDRYEVWSAGAGQEAFLLLTDWDSEYDAQEFFAAYSAFAEAEGGPSSRRPGGAGPGPLSGARAQWSSSAGQVFLGLRGTQVLLLRATDAPLLSSLLPLFAGF
ncbi:MAG: hypothetical protein EXR60_01665 [Dehalococcoidia bacterium]|nr:hypothetical protein [Dehalococcoidia bacterium]